MAAVAEGGVAMLVMTTPRSPCWINVHRDPPATPQRFRPTADKKNWIKYTYLY
jgi:hypothetical protein